MKTLINPVTKFQHIKHCLQSKPLQIEFGIYLRHILDETKTKLEIETLLLEQYNSDLLVFRNSYCAIKILTFNFEDLQFFLRTSEISKDYFIKE